MALLTDKFIFAHIPKTGGQYIRRVIKNYGIENEEIGNYHCPPGAVTKSSRLPVVISIRHPVTWYQSRWFHRIRNGWSPQHPLDWDCATNDFNQFVLNAIEYDDCGRFTTIVKHFMCKRIGSTDIVEHILQLEYLSEQLHAMLKGFGYDIDYDEFKAIQAVNISGPPGQTSYDVARYRPEVLQRLVKHERWVIDHFYNGEVNPNNLPDQLVL